MTYHTYHIDNNLKKVYDLLEECGQQAAETQCLIAGRLVITTTEPADKSEKMLVNRMVHLAKCLKGGMNYIQTRAALLHTAGMFHMEQKKKKCKKTRHK